MDKVIINFDDFESQLPPNPSPHRLIKRKRGFSSPGNGGNGGSSQTFDPEMEDLISSPLLVPILKNYEKLQSQLDPINKDINILKRYRKNPLFFWRDELGIPIDRWREDKPPKNWKLGDPVPLWSKQQEIIQAMVDHRKVAVKSGHGTGKTFVAGGMSLYFAYVWHCLGLTTAPTFRQVRRALWGEIHWLYNNAINPLGGRLNQVSLDLGDKWFVEGFATDKPMENITGIHEENVFVIIDEAGGVPDLTFEAIEGILTSENSFVLFIGNPINSTGPFADAFKPNSKFYKTTISCYDIPNVKYGVNIYSKLTSYQWVKDKEVKWGRESNMFRIRVSGEFPEESKDSLIPIHYIDAALERGRSEELPADRVRAMGIDVARGGTDSTSFGMRYESGLFRIVETTNKKRETDTAGRAMILYKEAVPEFIPKDDFISMITKKKDGEEKERIEVPLPPINVDDIGVGGGVVDILLEEGFPVNGIIVSESPDLDDEDTDHPELFLNKRAQYYWKLRNIFMDGKIAIEDEELAFELSKIRVEYPRGKIKIIDKEILKKAPPTGIGRSPDKAEDCMLACAKDRAESDLEMVRFL